LLYMIHFEMAGKLETFAYSNDTGFAVSSSVAILAHDSSVKNGSINLIRLQHPKFKKLVYFHISEDGGVFEVLRFHENCRSWFVDDYVYSSYLSDCCIYCCTSAYLDGDLLILSRIHPLYLVLPSICEMPQNYRQPFGQMVECVTERCSILEKNELLRSGIDKVCDNFVLPDDNMRVYSFNEVKCVDWLAENVEILKARFIEKKMLHHSILTNEKSLNCYAVDVLSEYLCEKLSNLLHQRYKITSEEKAELHKVVTHVGGEISDPTENYCETSTKKSKTFEQNMATGETLAERYKREDKEISKAFWEVLDINSRGTILLRFKYYVWRMLDIPATWMKENVVDPLQKDRKIPFYHRRFNRVRTIDECAVDDRVCYEEAQMQFHLDKMVDGYILDILRNRMQRCREYYINKAEYKCAKCIDDFEQAELNFYIKYGDMGYYGDVLTAYTKQKHRMIWERRHPEIMAARAEAREEHKRQMELGNYDPSFWKRKDPRLYKDYVISIFTPYNFSSFLRFKRDEPSQDPKFYKEREEARQKGEYKEAANPNLIWP
ncbi:NADH dehydrogenase [ubiquinone] 1 beta subcomplex subunit 10, partial [Trichinella pseudospiralis]